MAGGLIVEHLDGETLVYDTESGEAHCLDPVASIEFDAADNDVSRREVIRKMALVGAAAAGAAPLVKTIVAPTPAQAQTVTCDPACAQLGFPCCPAGSAAPCCDPATLPNCCPAGSNQLCCDLLNPTCCGAGTGGPNSIGCCPSNSLCCPTASVTGCCSTGLVCCPSGSQVPCAATLNDCNPSDRNIKHHLAPVEPQDVLAALGL